MLGTPNPQCLGGNCTGTVGTNLNVAAVFLRAGNGGMPISNSINIGTVLGMPTDCFPDLFPNAFNYGPIPIAMVPDGWGGYIGTLGPFNIPAAVAPNGLISQAYVFAGGKWQVSTPETFVQ